MDKKTRILSRFLTIYGWASVVLFSVLLAGFALRIPILRDGGMLEWTIWDKVSDHVGPMLFSIYIFWSIFIIRAAKDPVRHDFFLCFTMWANFAHGLVIFP